MKAWHECHFPAAPTDSRQEDEEEVQFAFVLSDEWAERFYETSKRRYDRKKK